ncbi:hypothetical protein C0Q70_09221 [Pomacea canaliculata]|uniref:Uncharacterized protein n=1 Tax=Pomacea canaliculata TaxID=400727 RepID=A0A2T7P967_POMCA|nr:hypothetical protein C0Q70_09221 [Pomacea canaliculata]
MSPASGSPRAFACPSQKRVPGSSVGAVAYRRGDRATHGNDVSTLSQFDPWWHGAVTTYVRTASRPPSVKH